MTLPAIADAASGLSVRSLLNHAIGHKINVKMAPYNAKGDGVTNDSAAIQAAINDCDPNRGGVVVFPQGRYVASGLTVDNQGTILEGLGMVGAAAANGTARIIVPDGQVGITFNATSSGSTHRTLGYGIRDLQVVAAAGATTGSGVVVNNSENFLADNLNVSGFIGGDGLLIDGKAGNAQYAFLINFCSGDNLKSLHLKGTGPNGCRMLGGYMAGAGVNPRDGSIGVHVETGDTFRLFGTVIQGYAQGIYIESGAAGHELHGPRFEYCNVGLHIGGAADNVALFGGSFVNSLLTGGGDNIGIQIDSGATNIFLMPTLITGTSENIDDNSGGGVTVQGIYGAAPGAPTFNTSVITADVTITAAGAYVDGPSLTLAPGTYDLKGALLFLAGSSAGRTFEARLWDGTTVYTNGSQGVTGTALIGQQSVALSWVITLATTTTVKMSGTSSIAAGDKIRGLSTKGSYLTAIKIG